MTTVRYKHYGYTYHICAEGHAGYDVRGKDIVCAAVSVLMEALALALTTLFQQEKIRPPNIVRPPDKVDIIFDCPDSELADNVLLSTLEGFRLLSENYPDHVKMVDGFSI